MAVVKVVMSVLAVTSFLMKVDTARAAQASVKSAEAQTEAAETASAEVEFYLVQDAYTAKCGVVQGRVAGGGVIVVGKSYKSQQSAISAMKNTSLCKTD